MNIKAQVEAIKRAYFVRIWEDSPQTRRGKNVWLGRYLLLGDDASIADFLRDHGMENPNAYLIGFR